MEHDDDRVSVKLNPGEKCYGKNGIMDTVGKKLVWSNCSVEDFTNYYTGILQNSSEWCLRFCKCLRIFPYLVFIIMIYITTGSFFTKRVWLMTSFVTNG